MSATSPPSLTTSSISSPKPSLAALWSKCFFQPGADIRMAMAQLTALSQNIIRQLPPGISSPLIITYSASTVPIVDLALKGEGLSEQELFDFGANVVRNQLTTIPGVAVPWPYGGKQRQVSVNVDIGALQAKGMSPVEVINAIGSQNLARSPGGTVKLGSTEGYNVQMKGSTETLAALNDLPIKTVNGATIYVRDVGHGQRRLFPADQHCSPGWAARRAGGGLQDRRFVHARYREANVYKKIPVARPIAPASIGHQAAV